MAFDWIKTTAEYLSSKDKSRPQDRIQHEQINTVLSFIALAMVAGVLIVGFAGVRTEYYVTVALLWSGAFFVTGWIVGFLFGIPRTAQPQGGSPGVSNATPNSENQVQTAARTGSDQQVNTNLEQISDWLTKILVGLGLTQIAKIPGLIRWLSNYVGSGIVPPTSGATGTPLQASAFAAGMFVYFTGVGFTGGYLLTRLILAGLFRGVDSPPQPNTVTQRLTATNPTLTIEPESIPQRQPTDVTISSPTAILSGATVTSANGEVVIRPPSIDKSDASHVTVSVTVPDQGDFTLLVRPTNSLGSGNPEIAVNITGK